MKLVVAAGGLLVAAVVAAQPAPQPPADTQQSPQRTEPPLSERQQERIAQQGRLIACNRQARDAGLRSGQRQEFIRDCLKSDSAAVGGGRGK